MTEASHKPIPSLWPLPGGNDRYLNTLDRILKWVANTPDATLSKAKKWLMSEYNVSKGTVGGYLRVVASLDAWQIQSNGKLALTPFGRRITEAEGESKARIVVEHFMSNFLAFPEVLAVYAGAGRPIHLKEMVATLQPKFPQWTSAAQFENRALWLLSLGCLQQAQGRNYKVTELGKTIAARFLPVTEIAAPASLEAETKRPDVIERPRRMVNGQQTFTTLLDQVEVALQKSLERSNAATRHGNFDAVEVEIERQRNLVGVRDQLQVLEELWPELVEE